MIDKELQKYYENRFDMMAHQGWLDLMEDIQAMLVSTNTLDGVDSPEKLHFRKGELSILNWLLSLKSVSEKAYGELNEGI